MRRRNAPSSLEGAIVGILIGTFALVAFAVIVAAHDLTQAAAVLGVAAALATFAVATVALRNWATRDTGAFARKMPSAQKWRRPRR